MYSVPNEITQGKETLWINPRYLPFDATDALCQLIVSDEMIADAEERLARFASFLTEAFPETEKTGGLIESPLVPVPDMQTGLEKTFSCSIPGRLLLKEDSHLAIAGSVKARGGIYEVLKHAETLALEHGILKPGESYRRFCDPDFKAFFSDYTVQVGSTGNLGMSIGIMAAALGFRAVVHMSADAKQWKKDLLRSHGVTVREYAGNYSGAVAAGRKNSDLDPNSYFVDDERSVDLFLGYAVAAKRLKAQLEELQITVDSTHPLTVYIPAGVGGAPGGIGYGLKRIYKDNVHVFFAEPARCPSVLLGTASGKYEKARVTDYGLSGVTEADGLACPSPSGFVTRIMSNLLSGGFTVEDRRLFDFLRLLNSTEQILIEPSSCAAFIGPVNLLKTEQGRGYASAHGLTADILKQSTQIVWATGGALVPEDIWQDYLKKSLSGRNEADCN